MKFLETLFTLYIIFCAVFTTFFLFGLTRHLRRKLNDNSELVEQLHNHIKIVYQERIGDAYYLYDKVSDSFIAQGATEDEMWYNAHLTFPKQDFIIEGENGKAVFVNVKDQK